MPYPFTFDLSRLSRPLLDELKGLAARLRPKAPLKRVAKHLVVKLRLDVELGLNRDSAERIVGDLLNIWRINERSREAFVKARRKALILPHCARRFMDARCKAILNPAVPTYLCQGCSQDCLIKLAKDIGESLGYEVYVVPGGSCLKGILSRGYEAVVGVACPEEIVKAAPLLAELGVVGQAVPLLRNGCANTTFSLALLREIVEKG